MRAARGRITNACHNHQTVMELVAVIFLGPRICRSTTWPYLAKVAKLSATYRHSRI